MYGDDAEVVRYTIAVVEVICYNSLKKNLKQIAEAGEDRASIRSLGKVPTKDNGWAI